MLELLLLDTLRSFARMSAAYAVSLLFALYCGFAMARNPRVRAILMPVLDILQSLPLVAFAPAAIGVIIQVGGGGWLGMEAAVVFLLWSCMAWNMTFGVYETLVTLPTAEVEGVVASGARGWLRLKRLELPACVPTLLSNSMMSWAGGWYFLIACEIIAVGDREIRVRGLGSYMAESMIAWNVGGMVMAIAVLVGLILLMDFFIWTPLSVWAERFRNETEAATHTASSLALNLWRKAKLPRRIGLRLLRWEHHLARRVQHGGRWVKERVPLRERIILAARPVLNATVVGLGIAIAIAILAWAVQALVRPWPEAAASIPLAMGVSFLRLLLAYALCLAWTVPVAIWLGESPRAARFIMPAAQILAAVPATAFFPFIALAVIHVFHSVTLAAVILAATGMQWYMFFSLVGGANAIPGDLRDAIRSQGLSRWEGVKRLALPAMLPSLITGSLAGWGGAWNALILTEFFRYKEATQEIPGIGSLLQRASLEGEQTLLVLGLVAMTLVIVLMNRFIWQKAYAKVSLRYAMDR